MRAQTSLLVFFILILALAAPADSQLRLAQNTGPAAAIVAVSVSSLTVSTSGPLKAGDILHAELIGSPGAKARFAIIGIASDIPMTEETPGHYRGAFTVPKGVNAAGVAVLGRLIALDGTLSPLLQAQNTVTIDNSPPAIEDPTPSDSAQVATARPTVYAALDDGAGAGVDPASVHLALDSQDITPNIRATARSVRYQPAQPLPLGWHTVNLSVADLAGNTAQKQWRFLVIAPVPAPSLECDLARNTQQITVTAPQPLPLGLIASAGGMATFCVGSGTSNLPMREARPGLYQATYTPGAGDSDNDCPVVAKFAPANGDPYTLTLNQDISIVAPAPPAPKIVVPADGEPISDPFQVQGKAQPNQRVQVTISYKSQDGTGLFEIDGNAVVLMTRANAKGAWNTGDISLKAPWLLTGDRVTHFFISAQALDNAGNASEADSVVVMRG